MTNRHVQDFRSHQLTAAEIKAIRDLATSHEDRHVPTGTWLSGSNFGKVFASASTWYRLIRDHRWRRPRQRIHPAKPKIGIRASRLNDIRHIDTTLIRLLDGPRAYLRAVIDNYSRRILAWKATPSFDVGATAEILLAASKSQDHGVPTVLADGGDSRTSTGELQRACRQTRRFGTASSRSAVRKSPILIR